MTTSGSGDEIEREDPTVQVAEQTTAAAHTPDASPSKSTSSGTTSASPPRPGPKPGPARPGPSPASLARPSAKPAASPATVAQHVAGTGAGHQTVADPTAFGRVDTDGNVWLTTSAGERLIGSWHAGDPEEGLIHFARRFDDLETEVALLETRLAAGTGDGSKTVAAARGLLDTLPEAAVIGDVDALERRLSVIVDAAREAAEEAGAEKVRVKAERTARKEELATEAEALAADSTDWKHAGDRLRVILEEWKTIRGVDRKADDALWKRYAKARDTFNRRRGSHFAQLDRERATARAAKEELVVEAEALSQSTEWGATSAAYRELLTRWKAAGRAPRDVDDALWARFKGAQDVFFAARSAADSEQEEGYRRNAERKEALLADLEAVDPAADLEGARSALRRIRDEWDEAGKVPRNRMADLEGRMRSYEKRVREASDAHWRRTDPEADARADQFRERLAHLESQLARAEAAGRTRDVENLRPQVEQWRQWAEAAASAAADR